MTGLDGGMGVDQSHWTCDSAYYRLYSDLGDRYKKYRSNQSLCIGSLRTYHSDSCRYFGIRRGTDYEHHNRHLDFYCCGNLYDLGN